MEATLRRTRGDVREMSRVEPAPETWLPKTWSGFQLPCYATNLRDKKVSHACGTDSERYVRSKSNIPNRYSRRLAHDRQPVLLPV